MPQGLLAIEDDMSRISAVTPLRELRVVRLKAGHYREQAAGSYQRHHSIKLFSGSVEMFRHLCARNKIKGSL
jgi:hypothetical protein